MMCTFVCELAMKLEVSVLGVIIKEIEDCGKCETDVPYRRLLQTCLRRLVRFQNVDPIIEFDRHTNWKRESGEFNGTADGVPFSATFEENVERFSQIGDEAVDVKSLSIASSHCSIDSVVFFASLATAVITFVLSIIALTQSFVEDGMNAAAQVAGFVFACAVTGLSWKASRETSKHEEKIARLTAFLIVSFKSKNDAWNQSLFDLIPEVVSVDVGSVFVELLSSELEERLKTSNPSEVIDYIARILSINNNRNNKVKSVMFLYALKSLALCRNRAKQLPKLKPYFNDNDYGRLCFGVCASLV